jgi:D-glycerate 3-kinase
MEEQWLTMDDFATLRAVFAEERIDGAAADTLLQPYGQIAAWLTARHQPMRTPLVVGICGAQGSGKSTLAQALAALIAGRTGLHVVAMSIDDFYLSRATRQALAAQVHPLFATRGVPGTHDVALAEQTIDRLIHAGQGARIALPRFSKATDDVFPNDQWSVIDGRADIILFEGWCVGARPETPESLALPVNGLERDEDTEGRWRSAVNAALDGPYRRLFERLDILLLLAAPGFDTVFKWRCEQEQKLIDRTRAACLPMDALMDDAAIRRFIDHYERLTRHILTEMPARADAVMALDASRFVTSLRLSAATDRHRP